MVSSGGKDINILLVTKMTMIIMLPKTSTYVKSYDGETKWMSFFSLKTLNCYKNILIFGLKTVIGKVVLTKPQKHR